MAMSEEHKAALARGRRESRAVKRYLEATATRRPGRPMSPERLRDRIAEYEGKIEAEADPLKALELRQKRLDAEADLRRAETAGDLEALEADFVAHAASYGSRKGISYTAWREAGVAADVLGRAGIPRTRS
jgi:hypothetical protein